MKVSFIILPIAFLLNRAYSATAHDVDGKHHHDVEDHDHHHDHDESIDHTHFEPYHDHAFRGLSVNDAGKHDFIRSGQHCGTRTPSKEKVIESNDKVSQWMKDSMQRMGRMTNIEVSTYFHVITSGSTGDISEATITSQLSVLNESYKPYGFSFKLIKTTRTNNGGWYSSSTTDSAEQTAMFNALRVGGKTTLNVYFKSLEEGTLGYCAKFPFEYELPLNIDGVQIASGAVPGGSFTQSSQGKVLVHEVGHWLGLFHTFAFTEKQVDGKCSGDGDGVSDTPVQFDPNFGCPQERDSCPFDAGVDMVSNFMDYSDDVCKSEFTKGQQDRMLAIWYLFRDNDPTVAPPPTGGKGPGKGGTMMMMMKTRKKVSNAMARDKLQKKVARTPGDVRHFE